MPKHLVVPHRLIIALGAIVACTVGAQGTAYAVPSRVFSGAICHHYRASDAGAFEYTTGGVRNMTSSPKWVICPLTIDPKVDNVPPQLVYVYGKTSSSVEMRCEAHYNDLYGAEQAWYYWDYWVSGNFMASFGSLPAEGTNVNILCNLPGNSSATIGSIAIYFGEW